MIPPSFKPVPLSLSRIYSVQNISNKFIFNVINIFDSFYYTLFTTLFFLFFIKIYFFSSFILTSKKIIYRLKTAENKSIKNELQKQKADIERKIAREEVIENATKHSGTLSWNELRFTLALPKVR